MNSAPAKTQGRLLVSLLIPTVAIALAILAWLIIRPTESPEPEYTRSLHTSWSFTLKNTTNRPLENVELLSFVPVDADYAQRLSSLQIDYPYQLEHEERAIARVQAGTLPPYGQRMVRVQAEVLLAAAPVVPEEMPSAWLASSPLIQSDDPEIQALAERLQQDDSAQSARAIHNWLTGNLEYTGYDPVDRGAVHALRHRAGDCTEFAALAVALARAMHIPARLVNGYVRKENGPLNADGYHAWAEILADERWIVLDAQKDMFDGPPEHYLRTAIEQSAPTEGPAWHRFYTQTEGLAVTMH